jgi:AraC-like DNA-binding protein
VWASFILCAKPARDSGRFLLAEEGKQIVNPSIRLADLADVYGYSDQAHLIREFKSFADCTPRDFAASAPAYFELRQNEDWCDFMKQYFNLSYAG